MNNKKIKNNFGKIAIASSLLLMNVPIFTSLSKANGGSTISQAGPAINFTAVVGASNDTIDLAWTDGNVDETFIEASYSMNDGSTPITQTLNETEYNNEAITVSGLSADTLYTSITLTVEYDTAGVLETTTGDVHTGNAITTSASSVQDLDATVNSSSPTDTIDLTWTSPDTGDWTFTSMDVMVNDGNGISSTFNSTTEADLVSGGFVISDAASNTNYTEIYLVVVYTEGTLNSNIVTNIMTDAVEAESTTGLSVSSVDIDSISLTWDLPQHNDWTFVSARIVSDVNTTGHTVSNDLSDEAIVDAGSTTITNLASGTSYDNITLEILYSESIVRVQSNTINSATLDAAATPITGLTATTGGTVSTLNLSWTAATTHGDWTFDSFEVISVQNSGGHTVSKTLNQTSYDSGSLTITGLNAGTTYTGIQIIATYDANGGTGNETVSSNTTTGTTLQNSATATTNLVAATADVTTELDLTWTAATTHGQWVFDSFKVISDQNSGGHTASKTLNQANYGSESLTITGLDAGTTYTGIQIIVTYDANGQTGNETVSSNTTTGTTLQTGATAATNLVAATANDTTELDLTWTAATTHGQWTFNSFEVISDQNSGGHTVSKTLNQTSYDSGSLTITGLNAGTTYTGIQIIVTYDANGQTGNETVSSNTTTGTTLQTGATAATNLVAATSDDTTELDLTWTAGTHGQWTFVSFEVISDQTPGGHTVSKTLNQASYESESLTITGLDVGATYTGIQIIATYDANGQTGNETVSSNTATGTTLQGSATAPTNFQEVSLDHNTLVVSWTANSGSDSIESGRIANSFGTTMHTLTEEEIAASQASISVTSGLTYTTGVFLELTYLTAGILVSDSVLDEFTPTAYLDASMSVVSSINSSSNLELAVIHTNIDEDLTAFRTFDDEGTMIDEIFLKDGTTRASVAGNTNDPITTDVELGTAANIANVEIITHTIDSLGNSEGLISDETVVVTDFTATSDIESTVTTVVPADKKLSDGAIAGIIVGAIAFIIVAVYLLNFMNKKEDFTNGNKDSEDKTVNKDKPVKKAKASKAS